MHCGHWYRTFLCTARTCFKTLLRCENNLWQNLQVKEPSCFSVRGTLGLCTNADSGLGRLDRGSAKASEVQSKGSFLTSTSMVRIFFQSALQKQNVLVFLTEVYSMQNISCSSYQSPALVHLAYRYNFKIVAQPPTIKLLDKCLAKLKCEKFRQITTVLSEMYENEKLFKKSCENKSSQIFRHHVI